MLKCINKAFAKFAKWKVKQGSRPKFPSTIDTPIRFNISGHKTTAHDLGSDSQMKSGNVTQQVKLKQLDFDKLHDACESEVISVDSQSRNKQINTSRNSQTQNLQPNPEVIRKYLTPNPNLEEA